MPRTASIPAEVAALSSPEVPSRSGGGELQPLAFASPAEPAALAVDTSATAAEAAPVAARTEPTQESEPTTVARATTYVNMRAGPDNDEPVVTVVPAKASIEVVD